MIITNCNNLPRPVYEAIVKSQSRRREGGFSVTELIDSPRVVALMRRHQDEVVQDAMDLLWSFWGTASHNIMSDTTCGSTEEKHSREIILSSGEKVTISGTPDYADADSILDYKFTSVWSWIFKSRLKKWEEQLQLYYFLNNYKQYQLMNILIFKDWDKNKAKTDADYPNFPIMTVEYMPWCKETLEDFVSNLVSKHTEASALSDTALPYCTDEEMWARPTTYAIYKDIKNKRAYKICSTEEEAKEYIKDTNLTIVKREGKRVRCEDYCPVSLFCNQYKEYKDGQSTAG